MRTHREEMKRCWAANFLSVPSRSSFVRWRLHWFCSQGFVLWLLGSPSTCQSSCCRIFFLKSLCCRPWKYWFDDFSSAAEENTVRIYKIDSSLVTVEQIRGVRVCVHTPAATLKWILSLHGRKNAMADNILRRAQLYFSTMILWLLRVCVVCSLTKTL